MNTKKLVLCGMFAALSAVISPFTIPIGPVPIGMVHVSIFLAAGLLGAKYGALSQLVFVLLGAAGMPIFSGFTGGLGKVMGPTGGYIVGYVLCALVTGLLIERFGKSWTSLILAMCAGFIITYSFGTAWFILSTNNGLVSALTLCVIPFLPGDAAKTILSALLIKALSKIHAIRDIG